MCGVNGGVGAQGRFNVSDLNAAYSKFIITHLAEGRPVSVLRDNDVWRLCGRVIPNPQSWFVTMEICGCAIDEVCNCNESQYEFK